GGLDGALGQLFLITTPVDLTTILNLLGSTVGIVDAEADQLLNLVGGQNQVTTPPAGLSDTTPVNYSGSTVWNGYVSQPAANIVRVSAAQTTFNVMGRGIVAPAEGVQFKWQWEPVGYLTRRLLRCAERRQRHQHELRHEVEFSGVLQSHNLRQPERRDLRGFRWKRWNARDGLSRCISEC